jgi:hypothetical protein
MGKPKAPPPPDYTPIAAASMAQTQVSQQAEQAQEAMAQKQFDLASQQYGVQNQQAQQQYDLANQVYQAAKAAQDQQYGLAQQQFQWGQDVYNQQAGQNQQVINADIAAQQAQQQAAQQAQQRYQQVYQPLENQMAQQAQTYASPDRIATQMGAASADVGTQFDQQRQNAAANLESFGVDPSSTRYAALDAGVRNQQAAAQAAAANQARLQTEATGNALMANAINVGRGLPGDVNAGYSSSVGAGQGAVGAGATTAGTGAQLMGTAPGYYGSGNSLYGAMGTGIGLGTNAIGGANQMFGMGTGSIGAGNQAMGYANQAIGGWGNTLNQGYQNQLAQFNANQNASSGFGSILGTGLGIAGSMAGFSEGGAVPDAGPQPGMAQVTPVGNPGRYVPPGASPTNGAVPDDVGIAVTPGEFVIPKDVVSWEGEKNMQKMIQKSRDERVKNTIARPQPVPPPRVFTRPGPMPAGRPAAVQG